VSKKDEKIIRVSDKVRIVNPEFFIRCGYPKTFEDVREEVVLKHSVDIESLLSKTHLTTDMLGLGDMGDALLCRNKIINAITYVKLKKTRFGGSERSIHTIRLEQYEGKEFHIFFVKTGTYQRGWRSHENDYSPAFLAHEKTHKILSIVARSPLEIEAKNVEKIIISPESDFILQNRGNLPQI